MNLKCDMRRECVAPATYVDSKGYVYCPCHAVQRKVGGISCRKLSASELRRIEAEQAKWNPSGAPFGGFVEGVGK